MFLHQSDQILQIWVSIGKVEGQPPSVLASVPMFISSRNSRLVVAMATPNFRVLIVAHLFFYYTGDDGQTNGTGESIHE